MDMLPYGIAIAFFVLLDGRVMYSGSLMQSSVGYVLCSVTSLFLGSVFALCRHPGFYVVSFGIALSG